MDIQTVIFDFKKPNKKLLGWARTFKRPAVRASDIAPMGFYDLLGLQRNLVCQWFLEKTDAEYLLMLDADIVPFIGTKPILTQAAPILGPTFIRADQHINHEPDGEIGAACLRISRHALLNIERPWFQFVLSPDGLSLEDCECGWFGRQARKAGYHPVRSGAIEHIIEVIATPVDGDNFRWRPIIGECDVDKDQKLDQ